VDANHWIVVIGGVLLIAALVETQFRRRRERSVRIELASLPVIYREGVAAKFMSPSGRWPSRTSRGMEIVVQDGVVAVVLANGLARSLLGTERYFSASETKAQVSLAPSVGYPRRRWVVLATESGNPRPIAVATRSDPQNLLSALQAAGVRVERSGVERSGGGGDRAHDRGIMSLIQIPPRDPP
jgi:hypothetical protein